MTANADAANYETLPKVVTTSDEENQVNNEWLLAKVQLYGNANTDLGDTGGQKHLEKKQTMEIRDQVIRFSMQQSDNNNVNSNNNHIETNKTKAA